MKACASGAQRKKDRHMSDGLFCARMCHSDIISDHADIILDQLNDLIQFQLTCIDRQIIVCDIFPFFSGKILMIRFTLFGDPV